MTDPDRCDVLVVGGGPAGLAAAIELRRLGAGRVVVADRERALGGIPRHTAHLGYGVRDLHRLLGGPAYAARYVRGAEAVGAELRPSTTVTELADAPGGIVATLDSAGEVSGLTATAVVVATGTRERPRSARLVAGDRPSGVVTTGALQQLVLAGRFRGRRAVVVGAEHVSFSAIMTLAHAGCRTVALVTPEARHQTVAPLAWYATARRVPILTDTTIGSIHGTDGVEAVEVVSSGVSRRIECDTVVFTGDWVPDHELIRRCDFEVDRRSGAPAFDAGHRLDRPGWFAAGNLLHGAESADVCALEGRAAARSVMAWLGDASGASWPAPGVPVVVEAPLVWASPTRLRPGDRCPGDRIVLRVGPLARSLSNRHVTEPGAVTASDPLSNRHVTEPGAVTASDPLSNRHVTVDRRAGGIEEAGGVDVAGGVRSSAGGTASLRHVTIRQGTRSLWAGEVRGPAGPNRNVWIPTAPWIDRIRSDDSAPIVVGIA